MHEGLEDTPVSDFVDFARSVRLLVHGFIIHNPLVKLFDSTNTNLKIFRGIFLRN